jgi:hypothetical protein
MQPHFLISNAMDLVDNPLDKSCIGTYTQKRLDVHFINWMHHQRMCNNMSIFTKYDPYDYGYLAFTSFLVYQIAIWSICKVHHCCS